MFALICVISAVTKAFPVTSSVTLRTGNSTYNCILIMELNHCSREVLVPSLFEHTQYHSYLDKELHLVYCVKKNTCENRLYLQLHIKATRSSCRTIFAILAALDLSYLFEAAPNVCACVSRVNKLALVLPVSLLTPTIID